jgi:hypothetical protein
MAEFELEERKLEGNGAHHVHDLQAKERVGGTP